MKGGSVLWRAPSLSGEVLVRNFPLAYRTHLDLLVDVDSVVGDETDAHCRIADAFGDCLRIRKKGGVEYLLIYEAFLSGCLEAAFSECSRRIDVWRAVAVGTFGYLSWVLSEVELRSSRDVWDFRSIDLRSWSSDQDTVAVNVRELEKADPSVFHGLLERFMDKAAVEYLGLEGLADSVCTRRPIRLTERWDCGPVRLNRKSRREQ